MNKFKQKKLLWTIVLTVLLIVSCDQDAFRHLDNAAKFFNLGMYEQAVIELKTSNRFLKDTPAFENSVYKYLMWGIIGLKEGDQQKAIDNFRKALAVEPKEVQIRFILSTLYLQQKDYVSAIKLFEDQKNMDITYGAADYLQGIKAYNNGEIRQAIKHFEKMLGTLNEEYIYFSDDPTQKIVIEQLRLVLYSMLGEAYLQLKEYTPSIKYYTKAMELDKQNIILDAKLKIAMLSYQSTKEPKNSGLIATIGYYYSILNLNDKAIYYYQKALALYPSSSPAYLGLATAYKNKLDYASAETALKKALSYAREPKMIAAVYLQLGQIYIEYDRLGESVQILSKAGVLDPENISIRNDLALAEQLKKYKDQPGNLKLNLNLAETYLERKQYPLAIKHFNYVESADQNNLAALVGLSRVYYLQNKNELALSYARRSLKLEPENLKALYSIADIYMAMDRYDLAVVLRNKLAYVYFYAGQNTEAIKEWSYVKEHINNAEMTAILNKIIEVIS